MLGETARVVTKGQKVLPAKAEAIGYSFRFPDLTPALEAAFAETKVPASSD